MMTSILELHLKNIAKKLTKMPLKDGEVLDRFCEASGIRPSDFSDLDRFRHFLAVRSISVHNLGRVNDRFRKKTGKAHYPDGPYVFYPSDVQEYRDLIERFLYFVESTIVHV